MTLLIAALLCEAFPICSVAAERSGALITSFTLENPSPVDDRDIMRYVKFKPGDSYDPIKVKESLKFLSLNSWIKNAILHREPDIGGVGLRLEIEAHELVRDVEIIGEDGIDEEKLLASISTGVDAPVTESFLTLDALIIEEAHRAAGFRKAKVTHEVVPSGRDHWVAVKFRVQTGEVARVAGYLDLGDAELWGREKTLEVMYLPVGAAASKENLDDAVERLVERGHLMGYPEARVKGAAYEYEEDGAWVRIPMILGPKTRIEVDTRSAGLADDLRALLRDRFGESINATWIERGRRKLLEYLVEHGYRNARVLASESVDNEVRTIRFEVEEGALIRISKVKLKGNKAIPDDELLEYLELAQPGLFSDPVLNPAVLERDLETLNRLYATRGYLSASVTMNDLAIMPSGEASLTIAFEEGGRIHTGTVNVICNIALPRRTLKRLVKLEEGKVFDPARVEMTKVGLLAELAKRGYRDGTVDFKIIPHTGTGVADLEICIESGPQVFFGETVISGNVRTRDKVIRRELSLTKGAPWNPQEVLLSRRRLFRLGYLADVRVTPIGQMGEDGRQDVMVNVTEQNAGQMTYGLGYGTEEGVMLFGEIGHANLGGYGRSLFLRARMEGADRSYSLDFQEPWLFNYPIDLQMSLSRQNVERDTYKLTSIGFNVSVEHGFTEEITGTMIYLLESNTLTDVEDEAVLSDRDTGEYLLSALGPVLVYDSRDNPFAPRSGYYHSLQAQWALSQLGSEVSYSRFLGSISGFFSLGDKTVLGLLARGGWADPFGTSDEMPVNKRFYLGGRSTVRGFAKDEVGPISGDGDPIGGDTMVNLKAEIRRDLWGSLGGVLFWDAGNVWARNDKTIEGGELRHSLGWGLRYSTPVGPVSFDIGYKMDRKSGESPYEWHFTIGNVF